MPQSDEMQELCRKEMEKWRSQLPASNTDEQPRQDPAHNALTHIDKAITWQFSTKDCLSLGSHGH